MRMDVREKRRIIFNVLYSKGPKGISELSKETGFDNKTVRKYCEGIRKEGLVSKKGRFGKYHITPKAYQYPSIKADLFRAEVMNKIFHDPKNDFFYNIDIERYEINKRASSLLAHGLFYRAELLQYVIKIGSFILYSLIKYMAPNKWTPMLDNLPLEGEMPGSEKDSIIKEAIEKVINPSDILIAFCKLNSVSAGLRWGTAIEPGSFARFMEKITNSKDFKILQQSLKKKFEKDAIMIWEAQLKLYEEKKKMNLDSSHARFELNEEVHKDLIKAFRELFPNTYKTLEKLENDLDDEIKEQISLVNDPEHIKCKGQINVVRKNKFERVEQCVECKRYFYHSKSSH